MCAECGEHGGHECGGGNLHGITRNRSDVGKWYPPISYLLRRHNSDLLNLAQTYDYVCPSVSDASMYPSPDDVDPAINDDGDLKRTIKLTPT